MLSTRSLSGWAVLLTLCIQPQQVEAGKTTVCYYRNWAQYKKGIARFLPEDIDPKLCTVISYAQMWVDNVTHELLDLKHNSPEMLRRLNALKQKNRKLKIFISVGGWNSDANVPRFSNMVQEHHTRATFIKSAIRYLRQHKLDGISLDWEYPTYRPRKMGDRKRFTSLLREMSAAFRIYEMRYGKRFFITLAVSGSPSKIKRAYDIPKIAQYVDWVNVMGYNLYGPWKKRTGCPTAMRATEKGSLTVTGSIIALIKAKMPVEKINLGLASYGRTFKLADPKYHGLGDRVVGRGPAGRYTKDKGAMSYYEICSHTWKFKTPTDSSKCGTPYAADEDLWVAYDNPKTIEVKARLVNEYGLNGVSMWALDLDDFNGKCDQGKYPLLTAAVRGMEEVSGDEIWRQSDQGIFP